MSISEIVTLIRELPDDQRRRLYAELDEVRSADTAPTQRSAHDKGKHLIGSISGPRDQATNPAYMEGYGSDSMS